jgi:hypothetical protein
MRLPEDKERVEWARSLISDDEEAKRKQRVLFNDIENIPLNLIVFWATFVLQFSLNYKDVDSNEDTTRALTALIVLYTFGRTSYSVCYTYGLQPYRSISFIFAELCFLCTCCILVYLAQQFDFDDLPNF